MLKSGFFVWRVVEGKELLSLSRLAISNRKNEPKRGMTSDSVAHLIFNTGTELDIGL